jgi:hydroxymethylglutaryl-CoA reductase
LIRAVNNWALGMGTMQFFRGFVIGTLNFVAFIAFFAAIAYGAWAGYENGAQLAADAAREAGAEAVNLPSWAYAVIGGVLGWLYASVVLGILFVLIDIQDGIRDLHRDLTKKDSAPAA